MKFEEEANGFLDSVVGASFLYQLTASDDRTLDELQYFWKTSQSSRRSKTPAFARATSIEMLLQATVTDLARLISLESARQPMKFGLSGTVRLQTQNCAGSTVLTMTVFFKCSSGRLTESDPSRFFHYELHFENENGRKCVIHAWKVLRNAPGFDVWLDTSTLFFEMFEGSKLTHRGVMRVPIEKFLRMQLPSMDITGTDDDARKSWALAAFYKYFVGELAEVYMMDAEKLKDLLWKLVTGIHV